MGCVFFTTHFLCSYFNRSTTDKKFYFFLFSAAPPEFRGKAAENDYGDFEKKFNFDNSSVIYNESEIESKKTIAPRKINLNVGMENVFRVIILKLFV